MAAGAAGSVFALTETLTRATPLIFTGLAAFAFRARLYNIGAEGQLYAGALASVAVGTGAFDAPSIVLVPMVLGAAALAGGLLMLGPTFLKCGSRSTRSSPLLLNFVVLLFVQMMLEGPFKDPMGGGWPQSEPILDAGALPPLVERMRLHGGFLIAVALAAALHIVMTRTVFGLKMRAVGDNLCRRYAGIGVTGLMLAVGFLSGPSRPGGRVGGGGPQGLSDGRSLPGFGYAGIVVAGGWPAAALGRPLRALHRRHLRRRRHDEPDDRSLELHRRPHRRARAPVRARQRPLTPIPDPLEIGMDGVVDILLSASFWAAAVHRDPLMFGVLGALLCERAGVLNLGIEGIFTAGAMAVADRVSRRRIVDRRRRGGPDGRRLRPPARAHMVPLGLSST